jgi:DNA-binding XRE family transcriptional regulator
MEKSTTWKELRATLPTTPDTEAEITATLELVGKIIELRKNLGLTQSELAEKSGVKQSAIARLERNVGKAVQVKTLMKLLAPLGYEIEFVPQRKRA